MLKQYAKYLGLAALLGLAPWVGAFSLLGPYAGYQTIAIGYHQTYDIGAPKPLDQSYRVPAPFLIYRIDPSFTSYFGSRGEEEIRKAVAILNNLPAASQMTPSLSEFPLNAARINFSAQSAGGASAYFSGLYDVKSTALSFITETMGLGDPERWVWTLYDRTTPTATTTNYDVIMRNYDPVTRLPSASINGTLFAYTILEPLPHPLFPAGELAVTANSPVNPLALTGTTVAGYGVYANAGVFYDGFSQDDAGAFRYLLSAGNVRNETLGNEYFLGYPGVSPYTMSFTSLGGTNVFIFFDMFGNRTTNSAIPIRTGWRGGVEKITFVEYNDSLGTTNYTTPFLDQPVDDQGVAHPQWVFRAVTRVNADYKFTASLLTIAQGYLQRTDLTTGGDVNFSGINNNGAETGYTEGPGVIRGPVNITFTTALPRLSNGSWPNFLDEASATLNGIWGAFDGSTNAPVIFYGNGQATPLF